MRLPIASRSADAVTIAFGIRNVERPEAACAELVRVLRPGAGRIAGVAAAVFTARLGTALTTGDAAILALTQQTAQTAAISSGLIIVNVAVRSAGAAGVVAGGVGVATNTPGLGSGIDGVSGAVDLSAAAGKSVGLSINGGAAAAWTITNVTAELLS